MVVGRSDHLTPSAVVQIKMHAYHPPTPLFTLFWSATCVCLWHGISLFCFAYTEFDWKPGLQKHELTARFSPHVIWNTSEHSGSTYEVWLCLQKLLWYESFLYNMCNFTSILTLHYLSGLCIGGLLCALWCPLNQLEFLPGVVFIASVFLGPPPPPPPL